MLIGPTQRVKVAFRWALPVVLVIGACWTANLTLFNWWAAGGPPTPRPEIYEHRGNHFFVLTVALLLLAVLFVVFNLRRRRASNSADETGQQPRKLQQ